MKTVKKVAKKVPSKPSANPAATLGARLCDAGHRYVSDVSEWLAKVTQHAANIPSEEPFPQEDARALMCVVALAKVTKNADETAKGILKLRRQSSGGFEMEPDSVYGRAVKLLFEDSSKAAPSWKDLAIKLAGELAAIRQQPFDEKVYVAQVQAAAEKSNSVSIKFEEILNG